MNQIIQTTSKRPSWTDFRAKRLQHRNHIVAASPPITLITIDDNDDEWNPAGNYDLVALWVQGRTMHPQAESGEIECVELGSAHYDRHWEYRTGRIGAVYAALYGRSAVRMMPEYDLLIHLICRRLQGCTREELEALYD